MAIGQRRAVEDGEDAEDDLERRASAIIAAKAPRTLPRALRRLRQEGEKAEDEEQVADEAVDELHEARGSRGGSPRGLEGEGAGGEDLAAHQRPVGVGAAGVDAGDERAEQDLDEGDGDERGAPGASALALRWRRACRSSASGRPRRSMYQAIRPRMAKARPRWMARR